MQSQPETKKPVSEKKKLANQRNAQKSTGPKTAKGKKAVALNAYKHGYCSKELVLPHEDAAAYEALRDAWFSEWKPKTEARGELVGLVAASCWKLRRCMADQTAAVTEAMNQAKRDFQDVFEEKFNKATENVHTDSPETGVIWLKGLREGVDYIVDYIDVFMETVHNGPKEWCSINQHNKAVAMICEVAEDAPDRDGWHWSYPTSVYFCIG